MIELPVIYFIVILLVVASVFTAFGMFLASLNKMSSNGDKVDDAAKKYYEDNQEEK